MGAVLVFSASIASLCAGLSGQTDPAFIGLCIAYALMVRYFNPIALRKAKIAYNFGLSECNRVKAVDKEIDVDIYVLQ